ncbi:helix-turn-helix transcriptional regulator [Enterococcus sp. BWB1-3]|uniref:helix-turn-helix domain-containing protein n=1 Tax=Enterococcus sp. BWB1-3 TaxID=2787713 RepID=UPI0019215DBF|nr:helix-turn-helix transcriptional regulator [Enterococcus sp. BWB1-3]MBL1230058.1 helix-turn-helix transcriptional regulator [Enterococcus sp. BWB1-3]
MLGNYIHMVKNFRRMLNLSQKEVAFGICSQSMLSDIENGKKKPSSEILFKLYRKLGIVMLSDDLLNKVEKKIGSIMYEENYTRIENLLTNFDEEGLNECETYSYYFYKGVVSYYNNELDDALINFHYAEDFVKETSRLDHYSCMLYKVLIFYKVEKKEINVDYFEIELNVLLKNLPTYLVLEKFNPFYFFLIVLKEIGEKDSIIRWSKILIEYLSKNYVTKYVEKIYRELALNELGRSLNSQHVNDYWEYYINYWLFSKYNSKKMKI